MGRYAELVRAQLPEADVQATGTFAEKRCAFRTEEKWRITRLQEIATSDMLGQQTTLKTQLLFFEIPHEAFGEMRRTNDAIVFYVYYKITIQPNSLPSPPSIY